MKEKKWYTIKNEEDERYLASIYAGRSSTVPPFSWAYSAKHAIHFENKDEAEATIKFIVNVIDWELAEQLTIIEIQE